MKQTASIISTYSADVFGVCSALFELGGMTVMHDASGCNSTYSTHDEPRWYDMESMVYISALSEMEAIMGDDEKLIEDIADAAAELKPKFIAIAGTPIPTMTGFDFEAVAALVEERTGIPAFGFPTTGMNTYVHGASMALEGIARRFVMEKDPGAESGQAVKEDIGCAPAEGTQPDAGRASTEGTQPDDRRDPAVNILGLTPLDFSVNGTDHSIAAYLEKNGFRVQSRWAMGCTLEELAGAANADVNLVFSAVGLGAAKALKERFGIPYVVGLPIGDKQQSALAEALKEAVRTGQDQICCSDLPGSEIVVIGEGITSLAIAAAIEMQTGLGTKVLCATECGDGILRKKDRMTPDEDDIIPELADAKVILADPLYQPICPPQACFISMPSEAFSGRIFRKEIIDPVADFSAILNRIPDLHQEM